jgi:hypothetical protein
MASLNADVYVTQFVQRAALIQAAYDRDCERLRFVAALTFVFATVVVAAKPATDAAVPWAAAALLMSLLAVVASSAVGYFNTVTNVDDAKTMADVWDALGRQPWTQFDRARTFTALHVVAHFWQRTFRGNGFVDALLLLCELAWATGLQFAVSALALIVVPWLGSTRIVGTVAAAVLLVAWSAAYWHCGAAVYRALLAVPVTLRRAKLAHLVRPQPPSTPALAPATRTPSCAEDEVLHLIERLEETAKTMIA